MDTVLRELSVGQKIAAKVLWSTSIKSGKKSNTSNNTADSSDDDDSSDDEEDRQTSSRVMQLTMRQDEIAAESSEIQHRLTWRTNDKLVPGTLVAGVVGGVDHSGAWIHVSQSLRGFVHPTHCSKNDDVHTLNKSGPKGVLRIGDVVRCVVLKVDVDKRRLELSLRKDVISEYACGGDEWRKAGAIVVCRLGLPQDMSVMDPPAIGVQLDYGSFGRVCVTNINEEEEWCNFDKTSLLGTYKKGLILDTSSSTKRRFDISLRESHLMVGYSTKTISHYSKNDIVSGYVIGVSKSGCFVRLTPTITARVMLKNLSDGFVKEPKSEFPRGMLVEGKLLSVNKETGRLEMTLKDSIVNRDDDDEDDDNQALDYKDLSEGLKLDGYVRKVESFGVFINLVNTKGGLSGMCHISECSDERIADLNTIYNRGARVRVVVLARDAKKKEYR